MVNLKEAFQAQNKIGELQDYITRYLYKSDNVMTITEKHLRSKALAGQQDDSVDVSQKAEEGFEVGRLLAVWQELMEEKDRLGAAIGKAKAGMEFNLDAAVDTNKSRRAFLTTLQGLASRIKAPMSFVRARDGAMSLTTMAIRRLIATTLTAS